MSISKSIKRIIVVILLVFIVLNLLPFTKLMFTDTKVAKAFLLDFYFVKVESNEYDLNVFKEYMEQRGWKEVDQLGGLHIFEKDGVKKYVINRQIKTFMKDGKLNLEYFK